MKSPFPWIRYEFTAMAKDLSLRLFHQAHTDKILKLPNTSLEPLPEADGAYTYDFDRELRVFSADCLSLLFFSDRPSGPIAAVHSGWRGAKSGIALEALEQMGDVASLWVAIGPSIQGCCFEVKEDFIEAFKERGNAFFAFLEKRDKNYFFHLARFVTEHQLEPLYKADRILWEDNRCTVCSTPPLPSFRRNHSTDPWICGRIVKCRFP